MTEFSPSNFEVPQAPDDTVQALKFNPQVAGTPIFLAAGSWDNTCRIWQVNESGVVEPKAMQNVGAPILAVDWTEASRGQKGGRAKGKFRTAPKCSSPARTSKPASGTWAPTRLPLLAPMTSRSGAVTGLPHRSTRLVLGQCHIRVRVGAKGVEPAWREGIDLARPMGLLVFSA